MNFKAFIIAAIIIVLCNVVQASDSIRLTDVVKSNGQGNIDFFKDLSAMQLEQLRAESGGMLVLGVDVNENASGTEKSTSQAVTLKSFRLTITYSDNSQIVYDLDQGCCFTETQTLVAESPNSQRVPYYTLIGESGSSRITASNNIQEAFDSTIKVSMPNSLYDPEQGIEAVAMVAEITWLNTNVDLGDPEAFYDYSNGFEDLAVLNYPDTVFIDDYAAGRDEAVAVILVNPPVEIDPFEVTTWNYFPSASSYYMVGYEDLYPLKGDYDFNDLSIAYQVRYGLNSDNQVVSIRGNAYLITRGAAFNHDWNLSIGLPPAVKSVLNCTTYLEPGNLYNSQNCSPDGNGVVNGSADIRMFSGTAEIFVDPVNSVFTNTLPGQTFRPGPKSEFRLDLETPIAASDIAEAPYDPYLYVRNTGQAIQLLQVNPDFKDENGFPFGMLVPVSWKAPLEFLSISSAYPSFDSFVNSQATQSIDWYNFFDGSAIIQGMDINNWAW